MPKWILYIALFISAVFVLQIINPGVTETFLLVSSDIVSRPWILVTSIFLHGDIMHLLYNMLALVLFGMILEKLVGERKFLLVFFVSGVFSSLAAAMLYSRVLGASGAVFGIIGALALLRPKMAVWAFGVPMPMIVAAGAWGILDIAGVFAPSGIANLGHLGGLFAGVVFGMAWRKKYPEPRKLKTRIVHDEEIDKWENVYMKVQKKA